MFAGLDAAPAGAWATMLGALFGNALSGRNAVLPICRRDGKKFRPAA